MQINYGINYNETHSKRGIIKHNRYHVACIAFVNKTYMPAEYIPGRLSERDAVRS